MKVSFDKKYFPSLLKHLMNTQEETMKKMQCGYTACGMCPLDHNEPLSK